MSHFSQPKMSCVVKNGFYAGNIRYRVVQSDNTLVFRSVRLEHETHAKYESVHVWILRHTWGFKVLKRHTSIHISCSTGTRDSFKVWNVFAIEYWRQREVHTKRNRFVLIIPKSSVKTEWGEFEVTTKCVNFSTQAKHMRCADNMKQKSSGQRTNSRSCFRNMPIFNKNFPGLRHGCTRHQYSRIL